MDGTSMACPHVSGVAALGLSYAVKQRRHFKASEFVELLKSSTKPLDSWYNTGEVKAYYRNHISSGASATRVELSKYVGKMEQVCWMPECCLTILRVMVLIW